MRVDVFCGGSDEPFVFEVSVADAGHAVSQFRCGDYFKLESSDNKDGRRISFFNPTRVDAIQIWEEK